MASFSPFPKRAVLERKGSTVISSTYIHPSQTACFIASASGLSFFLRSSPDTDAGIAMCSKQCRRIWSIPCFPKRISGEVFTAIMCVPSAQQSLYGEKQGYNTEEYAFRQQAS